MIKHKFVDYYGDIVEAYKFGGRVFVDCKFEEDGLPVFQAIMTPGKVRELANKLNELADQIEGN